MRVRPLLVLLVGLAAVGARAQDAIDASAVINQYEFLAEACTEVGSAVLMIFVSLGIYRKLRAEFFS